jgi:hypothetical protein
VDVPDFQLMHKAFVDEINRCGGINGRKIILKAAPTNPLASDPAAHAQSQCLKVTEDFKAFIAWGSIGGPPMGRCVSVQHQTIYDAPAYPLTSELIDAKGRLVSIFPGGDRLAAAFIADGVAQSTFKDKKITVLGTAFPTALAVQEQRAQYIDGLKKFNIDAELEMLPCQGPVCSQNIGSAVRRMKSNGTNLVIITQYFVDRGALGAVIREMKNQGVVASIAGPFNQTVGADASLAAAVAAAGADGSTYANNVGWIATGPDAVGTWRAGRIKETALSKMCQGVYAKAANQAPYQMNEAGWTGSKWPAVLSSCFPVRAFAKALYSLGNNISTARMAAALKNVRLQERETSPAPRDYHYFSDTRLDPQRVTSLRFNYPCPAPTVKSIGCFMPLDSPVRFRTVKF